MTTDGVNRLVMAQAALFSLLWCKKKNEEGTRLEAAWQQLFFGFSFFSFDFFFEILYNS
jgi:hypothetical protein